MGYGFLTTILNSVLSANIFVEKKKYRLPGDKFLIFFNSKRVKFNFFYLKLWINLLMTAKKS
jgi:hypothetical protein